MIYLATCAVWHIKESRLRATRKLRDRPTGMSMYTYITRVSLSRSGKRLRDTVDVLILFPFFSRFLISDLFLSLSLFQYMCIAFYVFYLNDIAIYKNHRTSENHRDIESEKSA